MPSAHHGSSFVFAADVDSAVTEAECAELARLAEGRIVLEIGSWYGRSTIALASTAAVVHSVDHHLGGPPDQPNLLPEFIANLERYGVRDRVVIHVGYSEQICPIFRGETFGLAFIDANHYRDPVAQDISLAAACLARDGTLALHDYGVVGAHDWLGNWHDFGVTAVVDEFCERTGGMLRQVETLAIISRPGRRGRFAALRVWS